MSALPSSKKSATPEPVEQSEPTFDEAPNSFNFYITTPGGNDGQITLRRNSVEELVAAILHAEGLLDSLSFTQTVRRYSGGGGGGSTGERQGNFSKDGKYEFAYYRACELVVTHPPDKRKKTQALWAVSGLAYETEDESLDPDLPTAKFPQHPIRIWKEPLRPWEIDLTTLDIAGAPYNISQFRVTFMKEVETTKIKKVVALEPAYRFYSFELGRELTIEEERENDITPFEEMEKVEVEEED